MRACARQFAVSLGWLPQAMLCAALTLVTALCDLPSATAADDPPANEAAADKPFYEQEPYDIVVLNDTARTQVKVSPLEFPGGKVPAAPKANEKIRLRRFDDPDEEYDVAWRDIFAIKLFDQLVLEQARKLVAERKFNDAFDYYGFLRQEYPKAAGLDEAIADFLYEEAKDWQRKRKYENALALLHTLYDRQPLRPGLEGAIAAATAKLIDNYVTAGDYASVRRLVRTVRNEFPSGAAAPRFEQQMNERAVKVVTEGRAALVANDPQRALALARRALAIWPKADGAAQLATEAFDAFPHVVVGVTSPYSPAQIEPLTEWTARRDRRLLERRLFEFTGYGADGGEYTCPFGQGEITELGRGFDIQLTPNIPWQHGDTLTGFTLARRLLALAHPERQDYHLHWAAACRSIGVRSSDTVSIQFREPQLAPAAMLTVSPVEAGSELPASIVPYTIRENAGERLTLVVAEQYFARRATQPQGIIEQRFTTRAEAVEALRLGEITMIDRLPPSQVAAVRTTPGLTVEPYSVPTVHCLVPNLARPFLRDRGFRRALVYGINRQKILAEQILKRQPLAGCEVVSGPFSKGAGLSDPAGYAYEDDLAPRPYEPRLALTLAAVALRQVARGDAGKAEQVTELPTLTLAHPADDIVRIACKAIQQDLELVNLKIELREIPLGQPTQLSESDDLLYVELAVAEPLVEAQRLLGEGGIIGNASTYMSLVLRHVMTATGWNEARQALHDLHRLTYDDVAVVPLWQITEHFAYHTSLSGVASRPASLFQAVEAWEAKVPLPAEEP